MAGILDEFNQNGFYKAESLMTRELYENTLKEFHELVTLQLGRFRKGQSIGNLFDDMQLLLSSDVEAYLGALRRSAKLISLSNYLNHPRIGEVTKLLGIEIPTTPAQPVFHVNSDKLKVPNGYYGFGTHQDWPSIQGSLDCIVVWAPLTPVKKESFPLQVLPGSHLYGLYEGDITANIYEIDKSLYDEDDYVSIEAMPGDVIFMSCWLLHRTGVEDCRGLRISVSNRWENAAEPTFIERGYPCAYKQSVERDFITPGFPSRDLIQKLYK
jgi:hypothetical protein